MNYTELKIEPVIEALLSSSGLQAISDAASVVMKNPFFIIDSSHKMLVHVSGDTKDQRLIEESSLGYISPETITYTDLELVRKNISEICGPYIFHIPDRSRKIMSCPVTIKQVIVAYVSVIDEFCPFEEIHMDQIAAIAQIVSTELQKNEFYRNNRERMFSYLLSDLLENKIPVDEMEQMLSAIGYHAQKYCYLLNVDLSNTESRQIVLHSIDTQIMFLIKNCFNCFHEDHYIYFFTTDTPLTEDSYEMNRIKKFLEDTRLKAALSDSFRSIRYIARNYQKTLLSLSLGRKLYPEEVLYRYSALTVYHALSLVSTQMNYTDFSSDAMTILAEYDRKHNSNLIATLETFLNHVCNVADAAEALYIHQNTLRQRIHRIEALTGVSFDNGYQVFELMLALQLYHNQKERTASEETVPL